MAPKSGSKIRNFPAHSLEEALVVVKAIVDKGAGQEMDRLLVAQAMGRTPSSSEFRRLLSSSRQYGLTSGTEKADYISPTELGLKIAKPENEEDTKFGLVTACLVPELLARFYRQYNRNKLPDEAFLKNTLEKTFEVDASHSKELAGLLVENARFCGILQDISGSKYIRIEDPVPPVSLAPVENFEDGEDSKAIDDLPIVDPATFKARQDPTQRASTSSTKQSAPKQLFVAHGKNRKPLEDLKKILAEFKIPFKVAVDEANKGRPISAKVAELMNECSAGVFIFTRDEQFFREKANGEREEVWRPSENVVYELGAASILWERKIIILREDGVNFPSDFSDLGYITFKDSELAYKALELLKELVGLQLVRVEAA